MTTHRFYDREKIRLSIKLNPLWWLGNDTEQTVDQAEWYHQDWPEWRRSLGWALRNPLQNFRAFVIGVQDRNYEVEVVHGNPDPQVVQRNDVGEYGYQVIKLKFKYGMQLPFVSYSGKRVVWYAGWQPSGFFGLKFNLHSERDRRSRPIWKREHQHAGGGAILRPYTLAPTMSCSTASEVVVQ
jgi:hypothetical protein